MDPRTRRGGDRSSVSYLEPQKEKSQHFITALLDGITQSGAVKKGRFKVTVVNILIADDIAINNKHCNNETLDRTFTADQIMQICWKHEYQ